MSYGGTRIARPYSSSYGTSYNYHTNTMPTSSGSTYTSSFAYKPSPARDYYSTSYPKTDYSSSRSRSSSKEIPYTPTYTTSTTRARSASKSRFTSPTRARDYEHGSSSSTPVDSGGRALPKGPGTRDRYGKPVDHSEHLSTLRSNISRGSSLSRDTRGPVRGDHSYGVTSPESTTSSPGGLSRGKRTNSVADLTSRFEDITVSKTSRKYGSNADLSSGYSSSHKYDDVSAYTTLPRKRTTDTSPLPDISINNKTSSPSPSLDAGREGSRCSRDRDDLLSPSRDIYSKASSSHNSTYSKSNGYASDYNNNSKGLIGLRNIGNTCFMNSVLQCLSNTPQLLDYCINEQYKPDVNTKTSSMKGQLIKVYSNVIKSLWKSSTESSITPSEFKNQIAKFAKRFVGYNQQDAQEFLIYLLEGLHEDINRVQEQKKRIIDDSDQVETISASEKAKMCWNNYLDHDNSKMVELFVGQLRSTLTCTECNYKSNTFDPFWDLSLPISKGNYDVSLLDCFDLFTQEETLDHDERPTCARCKTRRRCKKRFLIQKFPKVLVIHLKRFNQGSYYRSKLSTLVEFPRDRLDLSPYAADNNVSPIYSLYAVSNHSGSTGGGHYTAYAKNPHTQQWHYFNDQRVSEISERRVESSEAYVLFYQLRESSSRL